MNKQVRVRFAPSPTGPLHIGGVRTALYNYLFAKKHQGAFILRIEDTDRARQVAGAEEYITESLRWCGLLPDESPEVGGEFAPYRQSERKEIYRQYAGKLLESGNAYYAFDTPEELEQARSKAQAGGKRAWQYDAATRGEMKNSLSLPEAETEANLQNGVPYAVRLKIPADEEITFRDMLRGDVAVNSSILDDKVVLKPDGMPTYHLANVVDDHLMGVTHVIRGEEWLPSAPFHLLLYRFLGWEEEMPRFAHLPLILKPDGNGKLSKRDGERLGFPVFPMEWANPETGIKSSGFREKGYLPEAFVNMLAFLGWNPGDERELFTLDELIREFSLERVGKAGAKFDIGKAAWFNQQYLWKKSTKELAELARSFLQEYGLQASDEYLARVCGLMKERVSFAHEFIEKGKYFFKSPEAYDEKLLKKKWKNETPGILMELKAVFSETEPFMAGLLEDAFKKHVERSGLAFGLVMNGLRLLITGTGGGPSLFDIMELIGKGEARERIKNGLETVEKQIKETT